MLLGASFPRISTSLASNVDSIASIRLFYKKHVYKKHEAEIRQKLRSV